jgi:hypothetical protein
MSMASTCVGFMFKKAQDIDMIDSSPHWHAAKPYNQLPPLPHVADLETKAVLKQCITARAALGELKHAAELFPNQTMLINTIPLLEAKDSSEIENIDTTADQHFSVRPSARQLGQCLHQRSIALPHHAVCGQSVVGGAPVVYGHCR